MNISYTQFKDLKEHTDVAATLILKDLKNEDPKKYLLYERTFEREKAAGNAPQTDIVFDDIVDYSDFVRTVKESNMESEYSGSSKSYTKRLNRFIKQNRSLYQEYLQRMQQEYKEGF